MKYEKEELKRLQEQLAEKKRLEVRIPRSYEERAELEKQVKELEKKKTQEQRDVDRLEGHSLDAFFFHVAGNKDEKLDKERKEAYEARAKYDMAKYELDHLMEDIQRMESSLQQLEGCESAYQRALDANAEEIRAADSPLSLALKEAEERLLTLEVQKKELTEALEAGKSSLEIVEEVIKSLEKAENWGAWDAFGGGFFADAVKYDHLDHAQEQLQKLQRELSRFKTELMDVSIDASWNVGLDGFTRFADFFFDNIFTDWTVLGRIQDSKRQIIQTREQIRQLLKRLTETCQDTERNINEEETRRANLILQFDNLFSE